MTASASALSDNMRGSLFMLLAMASFAIGDGLMKFVSDSLLLGQILVIRGCFAVCLLSVVVVASGQLARLSSILNMPFLARILGEIIATFSFLTALFNMPIANASAIMQALPLTITAGAAIFFGEMIGWRRMLAISVGLLGVMMIIQPGLSGFNQYSLICLIAVFGTTLRDLATRRLPRAIPSSFVSLVTIVVVTLCGLVLSLFQGWRPASPATIGFLALASVFLVTGFFGIVAAMRVGEVAVVTPFRYFVLLFSIIIGILVFDEIPDALTTLGSAVVVGTGIYTIYRERMFTRNQSPTGTR